jgi:hypothetical protein
MRSTNFTHTFDLIIWLLGGIEIASWMLLMLREYPVTKAAALRFIWKRLLMQQAGARQKDCP